MSKKVVIIPKHDLETLARSLYPTMKEYFISPEGKKEFEEWEKEKDIQSKSHFQAG